MASKRITGSSWCAAINCGNSRKKGWRMFRFPKNDERCKQWVQNCRRDDLTRRATEYISKNCYLCSDHFEERQFMNSARKEYGLIWNAVPTLFSIPNPLQMATTKRKIPTCKEPHPKTSKKSKTSLQDKDNLDSETMPRNKDLPLLTCDLCSLSTKNHFIFKRHRQRCIRDRFRLAQMSIAPKSESKELGRDELSVDKSDDNGAPKDGAANDIDYKILSKSKLSVGDKEGLNSQLSMDVGRRTVPSAFVASSSSSSSPQEKVMSRLRRQSISDLDASSFEHSKKSLTTSSSKFEISSTEQESSEQATKLPEGDEEEVSSKSNSDLPPPNVSRHYNCNLCMFTTNRSKEFLYHRIEQHKDRIHVFSCTVCEYSSQYKHKLGRHMNHAHNVKLKNEEIEPEYARPTAFIRETQDKMPSALASRRLKWKRMVSSSRPVSQTKQSLESLLVKLKTSSKVTEANLSSFFTSASHHQPVNEGGSGEAELYKCKLCLFTGKSKNKVLRHLQACHVNARLFRCSLCTFKTYSKIEFYAHKKKHTNKHTTMFKCTECSYATEFRPNLDRHMLQHGCNKPNKCSLCSYATDHEGALKRHITSHHPNTAENQSLIIAGDEAALVGSIEKIIEDERVKDMEAEEGLLESGGFRCPICSLEYRRCSDLNRHMKTKHRVSRKDFIEYNSEDNDEETFELEDDEAFSEMGVEDSESEDSEESQPLSELRSHKPPAKRINKKCSYCSYIAKWPSDLRRHLRVHSVVKRFKCSLCWKKYKYLGDLNVHMRRDHEVNPDQEHSTPQKVSTIAIKKNSPKLFRCPACPFFTKVKVDMDRHSHEHTEAKTYSCKLCQYETYWRGDMGRHLYRKHPQEVSKDADLKDFFVYRPERKAISKGGKGLLPNDRTPNPEDLAEAEAVEGANIPTEKGANILTEKAVVEDRNEDSISDTISQSGSVSNSSETIFDKAGNKIYRCQLCSFSNIQAHKLKSHMDTHRNLKQFMCPVCGQRSNWKYDVRKHIASKHPNCTDDAVMMSLEEAQATIQEYISSRLGVKREYLKRKSNIQLNTSSNRLHVPSPNKSPVQEKKKRTFEYKCSHCQFRSLYRWSVSKHQRSYHDNQPGIGILAEPVTFSAEGEEEMSPYQEKDTGRAYTLEKSIMGEEEFRDELSNLYRCAECGKEGVSKGSIKKHYNYIHPNSEVRIVSVADGVEFNYYTGLPTKPSGLPPKPSGLPPKPSRLPALPAYDARPSGFDLSLLSSKYSDPKKHGYIRPFQCSVCGQRSNWKWDIKKHLRLKHPDDFGYVIVLQLDQARATCRDKHVRLSPANEAECSFDEELDNTVTPEKDASNTSVEDKTFATPEMPYKSQEMLLGRYRRYKCSGCGYRSNWRTDICRHIERRHRDGRSKVIFMDVDEAKETFMDYHYNPPNINPHTPGVSVRDSPLKHSSEGASSLRYHSPSKPITPSKMGKSKRPLTGKVWHCPKCPFVSALKSHIVAHMQNHGMKPFHCSACGMTSRFRSPIYRHIRKLHNSTNYSAFAKIVIKFGKPSAQGPAPGSDARIARYIDAYLCRLCSGNTMETSTKEQMLEHLLSEHGSTDASQALKIKKKYGSEGKIDGDTSGSETGDGTLKGSRAKKYFCTICPYRTDKRGMLTFHHAYHQPSSQNKFKCKYCPYYVCASRLLHQHMSLHEDAEDDQTMLESVSWRAAAEKTPPSSPFKRGKVVLETTPKRHNCEKCPYTTNSKNDFLYHKQFHRPKPAAEYKCEHCDYWVTHRRLLKQHVRLHGVEYQEDSVTSSPTKSLASDASAVLDAVEIAAIKQKMIANKITASLSTSPAVSPMKIATQCSVGNRPGFIPRNGMYKKMHHCRKCPYTNIRSRNVRLHELMHGYRKSDHHLMKCPYCDYYVGAKGLLSHHMKVHLQQYKPDPSDSTTFDLERQEKVPGVSKISAEFDDESNTFASPDIPQCHKVDTLLEISRFRKYSCEKCPYASGKRSHFLRHMELHGSRQKHTCQYCDYSVPSNTLLAQHQKIHLMPNQNLLATQSFSNLQHLKEVPADVALASALPPTDSSEPVTISVVHDHLELYENDDNNAFDAEPKKLYRCDRCPYANVRRDHLLTHLKFHLTKSTFHCPYCDYSAPKQQLLTQHIRVHFCPLPELSDWLIENGQSDRAQEVNDIDLTQALEVAEKFQTSSKRKLSSAHLSLLKGSAHGTKDTDGTKKLKMNINNKENDSKDLSSTNVHSNKTNITNGNSTVHTEPQPSTSAAADAAEKTEDKAREERTEDESSIYICQYCDREFLESRLLILHELQHLIGNHFEFTDDGSSSSHPTSPGSSSKTTEIEENHKYVTVAVPFQGEKDKDMQNGQKMPTDISRDVEGIVESLTNTEGTSVVKEEHAVRGISEKEETVERYL